MDGTTEEADARFRRMLAETDKLIEETRKFNAESNKLNAEARHFRMSAVVAPFLAGGAVVGGLIGAFALSLRLLGV